MKKYYGLDRQDEIDGAIGFWHDGESMEICSNCSRFERRGDFDSFSMIDYQSCENCRHLGPAGSCLVRSQNFRR